VVVVVGKDAAAVSASLDGLPVRVVTNPAYAEGMSTSLRVGLDALAHECRAALVALADQPGAASPSVVAPLLARYRAARAPIVAPRYRGDVRGNPVLFDASLFGELRAVTGDEGARSVIARDPSRVVLVEIDAEVPVDVDRPEDLRR
jgi:molybdenum cofactor cytidylyltransferase